MQWRVVIVAFFALVGIAACQTGERPGGPLSAQISADTGVAALQTINERGLTCWIRSRDPAFRRLALVPELDTRSGDPRILVVRRGDAQGLPQLVITASGDPVRLTTFGPLVNAGVSRRINNDILAWTGGRTGCA